MDDKIKENAHRLASALNRFSGDGYVIAVLAHYLHYVPEQLEEDMKDIAHYIKRLEEGASD